MKSLLSILLIGCFSFTNLQAANHNVLASKVLGWFGSFATYMHPSKIASSARKVSERLPFLSHNKTEFFDPSTEVQKTNEDVFKTSKDQSLNPLYEPCEGDKYKFNTIEQKQRHDEIWRVSKDLILAQQDYEKLQGKDLQFVRAYGLKKNQLLREMIEGYYNDHPNERYPKGAIITPERMAQWSRLIDEKSGLISSEDAQTQSLLPIFFKIVNYQEQKSQNLYSELNAYVLKNQNAKKEIDGAKLKVANLLDELENYFGDLSKINNYQLEMMKLNPKSWEFTIEEIQKIDKLFSDL